MKKSKLSSEILFNFIISKDFKFILIYCLVIMATLLGDELLEGNFFEYLYTAYASFSIFAISAGIAIVYETIKIYFNIYNNPNYLMRYKKRVDILKEIILASIKVGLVILCEYFLAAVFLSILKGNFTFQNVATKIYKMQIIDLVVITMLRLSMFVIASQCLTIYVLQIIKKKEIVIILAVLMYALVPFSFFLESNSILDCILPAFHVHAWGIAKTYISNIIYSVAYYSVITGSIVFMLNINSKKNKII
ncbi:MAG: hypothetical protein RR594_06075 [Clostridia bacterium]